MDPTLFDLLAVDSSSSSSDEDENNNEMLEELKQYDKYILNTNSLNILSKFKIPHEKRLSNNSTIYPSSQNSVIKVKYDLYDPSLRFDPYTGEDKGVINLFKLSGALGIRSFQKVKFPAVTLRWTTNPAFQIFNKGTCVAAGAPGIYSVLFTSHKLRFILRAINLPVKLIKLLRVNRVCSGDFGYPIDIENFEKNDGIGTVKQDDSFPGIIYLINSPITQNRTTFLIFGTGKFIVMGLLGSGDEEAQEAFDMILPILKRNILKGSLKNTHIDEAVRRIKKGVRHKYSLFEQQSMNPLDIMQELKNMVKKELQEGNTIK